MEETQKPKMLVIYHRVDYDGLFSYAIIHKRYKDEYEIVPFGYNHTDKLLEIPSFKDFERIIIADIALPTDMMSILHKQYYEKVEWIDHHITSIDTSAQYDYANMKGVRYIKYSACKLCYQYFFDDNVPYAVDLVATNDIWDKERYHWNDEVQAFQCGLGLDYKLDAQKVADSFDYIIDNAESIISKGKAINDYMTSLHKSWCELFSFPILVNNKWKGIAMIAPTFSSKIFKSISDTYDCCIVLNKNGQQEGLYNVSMYSTDKVVEDMSCGDYMKQMYQGGGHKGAGGGTLTLEQFTKAIQEHKI